MNKYLDKLCRIAAAESRVILGLMSGTSLDGLDLALCRMHGHGRNCQVELLHFHTIPYTPEERSMISEVSFNPDAPLSKICLLNARLADIHGRMIRDSLKTWHYHAGSIDLIASHGQTIFHAPASNEETNGNLHTTLQIGDGDRISVQTGIICISDFRQKHIAGGGEGAPLAAYGDYLLFSEQEHDVLLINIGGIANISFLPAGKPFGQTVCGDTGPGNKIMDAYWQSLGKEGTFDKNGELAAAGKTDPALLNQLKSHPYFSRPLPKTTGPELFNLAYLEDALLQSGSKDLTEADIMATLNRFTADTIAEAAGKLTQNRKRKIILTGGGIHNNILMGHLKELLHGTFIDPPFPADAKEAVLFAILANECVAGHAEDYGGSGPNLPSIGMGKISLPG